MLRPRTVREGSVGLFALLGLVLFGGVAVWLRGGGFGEGNYQIVVEFDDASGLQLGAPVRFRGVNIGRIRELLPGSNGVEAVLEIASKSIRIPRDATIEISRYGLIGEASVDIIPQIKLSEQALAIAPDSAECQQQQKIICANDRLTGEAGSQLVSSLTRLSNTYSDPKFVGTISQAIQNASETAVRISKMSDEIALLSKTARSQISGVTQTTTAITNAANHAGQLTQNLNQVVLLNQATLTRTISEASKLMTNLNNLVNQNQGQITDTLLSIQGTSRQIQVLTQGLDASVVQLNTGLTAVNPEELAKNLQIVVTNANETTRNLREISENLNNPAILLTVQQTLDSARVTFENAQKITSDVEQLTGDPTFRNNLRRLVDGLGNLVSSTESLEQQIHAGKVLRSASIQLQYQIDVQQRLAHYQTETLKIAKENAEQARNPHTSLDNPVSPLLLAKPYLKASPLPNMIK
ncbi:MAG: MlaD family protein [Snowella sp.]|nr:MlaD family protein [Snowella sp.]